MRLDSPTDRPRRLSGRGVERKSLDQIKMMRAAGLVVARGLAAMRAAVAPGVSTLELDALAREVLADAGAIGSFVGYQGYPAAICASVNEQVVHGIPSASQVLREGDLLSLDFGAVVDGWHGDAAITVPVGAVAPELTALSEACHAALWAGIAAARPGGRLGYISHAVQATVRVADRGPLGGQGYGIVTEYGGHGIGTRMHMDPIVPNHGPTNSGPRLAAGMVLAIEPMITLGGPQTRELSDAWTVVTVDGSPAAHWEHTVAILDDGPWVLTAEDGGRAKLGRRGSTHMW